MITPVVMLLLLFSQPDAADLGVVGGVPLAVASVTSGGWWTTSGSEGRYRIIVLNEGWEHIHSKIFGQWIEAAQADRSERVVRTIPIDLSSDGYWSVGPPRFLPPDPVATQVEINATDSMSDAKARFIVTLKANGKYSVERSKK